jgi:hypothetical protein
MSIYQEHSLVFRVFYNVDDVSVCNISHCATIHRNSVDGTRRGPCSPHEIDQAIINAKVWLRYTLDFAPKLLEFTLSRLRIRASLRGDMGT